MTADLLHGLMKLFTQICPGNRNNCAFFLAVLSAFCHKLPQHHFRMVNKIAIKGNSFRRQPQVYPIRFNINGMIPLFQEDNVGYHICTGIGTECVVRQSDGSQKLCSLCEIFSGIRILRIHGIAACNKSHHAARSHLIESLRKEIVVNRKAQLVVGLIADTVVAEGDVSNSQIVEISVVGGLKACHRDLRLGVKFLRNPSGNGIQFHAVKSAFLHGIRQHSEEVSDSHGRLQDISLFKAHVAHCFINCLNHRGTCVMRIQG